MIQRKYVLILLSLFLAGCQSRFPDLSQKLSSVEISKISKGKYTGIAWVNESTLVLKVDEGSRFENQRMCSQQTINILEMNTNQLRPLPSPFGNECTSYVTRDLQVLPNQQAGYIFEYPKLNSRIIKIIDIKTGIESDFYSEPPSGSSFNRFSYSPDMSELLFVDAPSYLMRSAIYLLNAHGTPVNITADFLRADFPAWSTKNNLIAFLGTKPYPGSDDKIEHFSQTEARLDYPWRLNIYNPEHITTEELPFDVVGPSSLKWSPDGKMLAFSGEYNGRPGVWIVDDLTSDNLKMTRVIDGLATFDFSPDSKSIAYAYIGLQNTEKQNTLYKVNLMETDLAQ